MSTDYDLLSINGIMVTDTEVGEYDIAVKDEKVTKIFKRGGLQGIKAIRTIDAEGGYVMVRSLLLPLPTEHSSYLAWRRRWPCPSSRAATFWERIIGRQL